MFSRGAKPPPDPPKEKGPMGPLNKNGAKGAPRKKHYLGGPGAPVKGGPWVSVGFGRLGCERFGRGPPE